MRYVILNLHVSLLMNLVNTNSQYKIHALYTSMVIFYTIQAFTLYHGISSTSWDISRLVYLTMYTYLMQTWILSSLVCFVGIKIPCDLGRS